MKNYPMGSNGHPPALESYGGQDGRTRNGGGITWKIVAGAGASLLMVVIGALAIVLFSWMQNISSRVDELSVDMGKVTGWIDAQKAPQK